MLIIPEGELNAFSAVARNPRAKFNDRDDIAPAVLINVFNPGLIVSFADILIALMLLSSAIENLNAVRKLPPILGPNRGDLKWRDTNLRRQISNNLADARLINLVVVLDRMRYPKPDAWRKERGNPPGSVHWCDCSAQSHVLSHTVPDIRS